MLIQVLKVLRKRHIRSRKREYHVCLCACWGGDAFPRGHASYVRKGGGREGLQGRVEECVRGKSVCRGPDAGRDADMRESVVPGR